MEMSASAAGPTRHGIGHAQMCFEQRTIRPERSAVALINNGPALENGSTIGDAEDLLSVLLHHDRRHSLFTENARQRLEKLLDDDRCEAFSRLVEQQHLGIED